MNLINRTYSFIFLVFSVFVGISTIGINKVDIQQKELEQNTITRSVSSSNLKDDIEKLAMSVNATDRTISYEIEFKSNDFDGTEVNSYFFHIDPDATFYGSEEWLLEEFNDSTEIVQNKKASNTTSYSQIDDLEGYQWLTPSGLSAALNVSYEKDGVELGATIDPIYLNLGYFDRVFAVEDSETTLSLNDDMTFATIGFNAETTNESTLAKITLKSHSDDNLNQVVYDANDLVLMPQGSNSKSLKLLSEYHYYDLYLEFTFSNFQGGFYLYESDIVGVDFTSGFIPSGGIDIVGLIFMLLIILLVIFVIFVIILIVRQIQKRKELERQQDQAYYDENYEEGMN